MQEYFLCCGCFIPMIKGLAMAEKVCLKWDKFKQNFNYAIGNFRVDNDLMDVTLACADGQQMEAHKVILAASSPTFRDLFKQNKHPHPLIFTTRTKSSDLSSILDFLYLGEANIPQIDLESFLALAEQLQLDGLMGPTPTSDNGVEQNVHQGVISPKTSFELKEDARVSSPIKQISSDAMISEESRPIAEMSADSIKNPGNSVLMQNNFYGALDLEVQTMMEMTQNTIRNGQSKTKRRSYSCKVCGKEGYGSNIKKHIEANHLKGLSVPCDLCEKRSRSIHGLGQHKVKYHR